MLETEILTTTSHPEKLQSAVCSPARRVLMLTPEWFSGPTFLSRPQQQGYRNPTRHILGAIRCSPYTASPPEAPRVRLSTTASLSEQPLSHTLLSLCMAAVPEAPPPAPPLSSPTPHQRHFSDCLIAAPDTSLATSASGPPLRNGLYKLHLQPRLNSRFQMVHFLLTTGRSETRAGLSTSPPPRLQPSPPLQCLLSPSTPTASSALRHRPPAPSSPSAASPTSSQTQPLPSMARSRRRISFPPVHTPITLQTTT